MLIVLHHLFQNDHKFLSCDVFHGILEKTAVNF